LSMWSNRWSTMPVGAYPDFKMPMPDERAVLDKMPGTTIPVIRQPFQAGDLLPFWAYAKQYETILFDRHNDPLETINHVGESIEADAVELLRVALQEVEAPTEHFVRLGLN